MNYFYTINAIKSNAIEFERRTGNKPTRVYLGNSEIQLLKELGEDYGVCIKPTGERSTIDGLFIFHVNEELHIGVA